MSTSIVPPHAGEIGKPLRRFTIWPAVIPVPVRRETPEREPEPAPATREPEEAPTR